MVAGPQELAGSFASSATPQADCPAVVFWTGWLSRSATIRCFGWLRLLETLRLAIPCDTLGETTGPGAKGRATEPSWWTWINIKSLTSFQTVRWKAYKPGWRSIRV